MAVEAPRTLESQRMSPRSRRGIILDDMFGELIALAIVALLLGGAAYSGMAARAKPPDEERVDPPDTDNP